MGFEHLETTFGRILIITTLPSGNIPGMFPRPETSESSSSDSGAPKCKPPWWLLLHPEGFYRFDGIIYDWLGWCYFCHPVETYA